MPALVKSWTERNGLLRITASRHWLRPPYSHVLLPLAHQSPVALALQLFLSGIDTRKTNKVGIPPDVFSKKIGIGRYRYIRALDRALDIVNLGLKRVSDRAVEIMDAYHIKVPIEYKLAVDHSKLRFYVTGHRTIRDIDEIERDTEPRPQQRRRVSADHRHEPIGPRETTSERQRREAREAMEARAKKFRESVAAEVLKRKDNATRESFGSMRGYQRDKRLAEQYRECLENEETSISPA
jgi:hypothetical protein